MMAGASSISPRKLTHSLKNEWDEEEEKKKEPFHIICVQQQSQLSLGRRRRSLYTEPPT